MTAAYSKLMRADLDLYMNDIRSKKYYIDMAKQSACKIKNFLVVKSN